MRRSLLQSVMWAALSLVGAHVDGAMARDAPIARTTAFVHVNLIPMTKEQVIQDQTVLIKDGRIVRVGSSPQIEIPPGVLVIDGHGAYLMPGLADMHMHTREDWLGDAWPISPLKLYLANGVTTIRDFGSSGNSLTHVLHWREKINQGNLVGPTIYASGLRPGHPTASHRDPEEIVWLNKAQGFDFLKLYSFLSNAEFQIAINSAKQLKMYTAGHIPFAVGLDGVLEVGMDEIAHVEELDFELLSFDRNKILQSHEWIPYILETTVKQFRSESGFDVAVLEKYNRVEIPALATKLKNADVTVCTTLAVGDIVVQKLFHTETFLARPENRYLPPSYLESARHGREKHQLQFKDVEDFGPFKYALERYFLAALKRTGVRLVLGTDAGTGVMGIVPGFSIHDELQILVENGFTPYEAIAAATVVASQVVEAMLGTDEFGTIEVGKRADLIMVNRNPLEDVNNIKDLKGVMSAGRWYSKRKLERLLTVKD